MIYVTTGAPALGMTYVSRTDAAQRGIRAFAFAAPLLQSHSPQRSEDAASFEQSSDTCPGLGATQQQDEGECLLQCLYIAHRCDRPCAGCIVTAGLEEASGKRAEAARSEARTAAVREGERRSHPDGNHGDRKISEGGKRI